MSKNEHKTVCANTRGIIVSFRDVNKHKFVPYNRTVEDKQLYGSVKYQSVFNKTQEKIYVQTVYGLDAFSYKEIKAMSVEQKSVIIQRYSRVQKVISKLKSDCYELSLMNLLKKVFHHSELMQEFCKAETTPIFSDILSQEQIAKVLVQKRLLPENFFQLA